MTYPTNREGAVDRLLRLNRRYERTTGPGSNNHVPMVLIALYRLGGSTEQMFRYARRFGLDKQADSTAANGIGTDGVNPGNWRSSLGRRSEFPGQVDFFRRRIDESSVEAVLKEYLDVLIRGVSTEAYHALLRLAYALDYGDSEEVAFALAYWSAFFYPGPGFSFDEEPLEPAVSLAGIVGAASGLRIEEVDSIDGRIQQVYRSRALASVWRRVRLSKANPLRELAAVILKVFSESHHFTLLHALTSCQAFRRILPYLGDTAAGVSHYWNSVCAAYLTVARGRFEVGHDTVGGCDKEWREIFAGACAREDDLEHTLKLAYACHLESQCYAGERYRLVACRELDRPSPFL